MSRARDLANSADNDISGTLTVDDITLSGNITVGGTVDGRDLATDGAKLDGVEANATADQTKADIDALNINADTLDGQHGSYYTTYADTAVSNLVDSAPTTLDTLNELAAALGDDPNFATTVTASIGTKLNASDYTAADVLTKIKTVDGSGSGLDADTLDGSHASAFLTGNQTITLSGDVSGSGTTSISVSLASDSVGAAEIAANAVGASELNVTGNGTTSQFLRSDGDGTFTWATPTDTNTTYSAGAGLDLSSTTFSVESDLRGDAWIIGRDTNDFISVNTTNIDFVLDNNTDMRLENDGDLHVDGNVVAYSTTTSDPRLKENIQPVTNGLEKVMQLNGYTFDYKADGVSSAGILSTEVAKVLPSAVKQSKLSLKLGDDNDTEYDVVQYDQLTALLIEAIKELKAEIEELKNGSTN